MSLKVLNLDNLNKSGDKPKLFYRKTVFDLKEELGLHYATSSLCNEKYIIRGYSDG